MPVGDTLFMPDGGSARCDFPNGCARQLYCSVKDVVYNLPDNTRMFVGHDYAPNGRDFQWETTVGEQKAASKHLKKDTLEENFVLMREERDGTLPVPNLLYPSVQVRFI